MVAHVVLGQCRRVHIGVNDDWGFKMRVEKAPMIEALPACFGGYADNAVLIALGVNVDRSKRRDADTIDHAARGAFIDGR